MLEAIKNAFKTKDIRKKILFTLAMIVVIRLGSAISIPGIDPVQYKAWYNSLTQTADGTSSNLFGLVDRFTGGSFENMSVFALNITPYITSSIIVQLLTIAFPSLEEMQRDGEEGRKKLTKATRILTVGLALFESLMMGINFYNAGYLTAKSPLIVIQIMAAITAGSTWERGLRKRA